MAAEKAHSRTVFITLIVMLSASCLSLWLAYLARIGMLFALAGLAYNIIFGALYWKGKHWAKHWLLGRYVITMFYAAALLFVYHYLLASVFEALISLCMVWLLLGRASPKRAYAGLGIYILLLAGLGTLVIQIAHRRTRVVDIVEQAPSTGNYHSSFNYDVTFTDLPWKALTPGQAQKLLGQNIKDADLHLMRDDSSSFALFFPLQFRNIPFSDQVSAKLENEIQTKWLSNLHDWHTIPLDEGFMLTAQGQVKETKLGYVIFYKHFGNLGVYAVFWGKADEQARLLTEASVFYQNLTAPPVKARMTRYSPAQIYDQNSEAVVLINLYDEEGNVVQRGSGFNIADDGLVVTSLHVLTGGERIELVFPGGEVRDEVQIAALSPLKLDLALLTFDGTKLPTIGGFQSVDVAPGDVIYVIGNPKGLVGSVSEGIIGGVRDEAGVTFYQITAPLSSGSSGGPVFNEYGEVIGVANSVVRDAQNINFSVAIDQLSELRFFPAPVGASELPK